MIPLGRSIPNLPTTSDGQAQQPPAGPAAFGINRRRSSIDAIMGHLRYVGQFGAGVMQDLSQPRSNQAQPAQLQRPSMQLPGGFLGMQSQQSFGSSTGSLFGRAPSSLNLNDPANGQGGSVVSVFGGGSGAPAQATAPLTGPKLPAAEEFLSI
ncbi:hypothetical protein HKX48_003499 [Thoreauomyces humboldtii]|nr:hypothetical protein HKX48_003499 [Thoreauomyces humboldtii]